MPRNAAHDSRSIKSHEFHEDLIDAVEQEDDACETQPESAFEPGALLKELEARQDEVLRSLSDLDRQICAVLADLGVTVDGNDDGGDTDYIFAMRDTDSDAEEFEDDSEAPRRAA
jgi:hypothetical protein